MKGTCEDDRSIESECTFYEKLLPRITKAGRPQQQSALIAQEDEDRTGQLTSCELSIESKTDQVEVLLHSLPHVPPDKAKCFFQWGIARKFVSPRTGQEKPCDGSKFIHVLSRNRPSARNVFTLVREAPRF